MTYGPYLCIGAVLVLLFVIWAFFGGKDYEFIGLAPLNPDTCGAYTGSIYNWGNNAPPDICVNPNASNISTNIPKSISMATIPSRGERICCQTMERIYGVPFINTRPEWLQNYETGEPLELDCYNEDLAIAVEYNGEQHYLWPNWTGQSQEEFINQVRRDELKRNLCDKNGVYLIVVPYDVPMDEIPEYITSFLPETIRKRIQDEQTLFVS